MNFENISAETMEKVKACKTPDELLELAKTEGYELSDAELEEISGGKDWWRCEDYRAGTGPY